MARIPILAPLVPKGDGRTINPEPMWADRSIIRQDMSSSARLCWPARAIAANGPRMESAARKQHHLTASSPITSKGGHGFGRSPGLLWADSVEKVLAAVGIQIFESC
jgi:hypothetical protein